MVFCLFENSKIQKIPIKTNYQKNGLYDFFKGNHDNVLEKSFWKIEKEFADFISKVNSLSDISKENFETLMKYIVVSKIRHPDIIKELENSDSFKLNNLVYVFNPYKSKEEMNAFKKIALGTYFQTPEYTDYYKKLEESCYKKIYETQKEILPFSDKFILGDYKDSFICIFPISPKLLAVFSDKEYSGQEIFSFFFGFLLKQKTVCAKNEDELNKIKELRENNEIPINILLSECYLQMKQEFN